MIYRLNMKASVHHDGCPALDIYKEFDNPVDFAAAAAEAFRNDLPDSRDCSHKQFHAAAEGWLHPDDAAYREDFVVSFFIDYDDGSAIRAEYYGLGNGGGTWADRDHVDLTDGLPCNDKWNRVVYDDDPTRRAENADAIEKMILEACAEKAS